MLRLGLPLLMAAAALSGGPSAAQDVPALPEQVALTNAVEGHRSLEVRSSELAAAMAAGDLEAVAKLKGGAAEAMETVFARRVARPGLVALTPDYGSARFVQANGGNVAVMARGADGNWIYDDDGGRDGGYNAFVPPQQRALLPTVSEVAG